MKSFFLRFALALGLAAFISPLAASPPANTPEATIRSFYHWYVGELIADVMPFRDKRGEMHKFVSERFLKELAREDAKPGGIGYDPFVDAQDFDNAWASNIAVRNVKITGARATARVVLGGGMIRRLTISLVQERGIWKIDGVRSLD